MYVLYENDNLLERFRLQTQNGIEPAIENGEADANETSDDNLRALQMSRRLQCGPSSGFVLLVAKWSKMTLETLSDTVRLVMSQVSLSSVLSRLSESQERFDASIYSRLHDFRLTLRSSLRSGLEAGR